MPEQSTASFGVAVGFTGGQVVVSVSGDLDVATAPELDLLLAAVVDRGRGHVVLDLANVDFMGGAAIGPIKAAAERLRSRGSRLEVRSVPRMGMRLLEALGLHPVAASDAPASAFELFGFSSALTALPADDLIDTGLQLVADVAPTAIPHVDGASVSLRRDGVLTTVAASVSQASDWDDHQYRAGDGPCIEASIVGEPMHVPEPEGEQRWQPFMEGLRGAGITSILSMPVATSDGPLGSLNLYSRRPAGFTGHEHEIATRLAAHAGGLIERVSAAEAVDLFGRRFEEVLAVRDAVSQAQGMLMDRSGVSAEEAFTALQRFARHTGSPLTEYARDLADATRRLAEIDLRTRPDA
jgi:anti-anti-sigma factor